MKEMKRNEWHSEKLSHCKETTWHYISFEYCTRAGSVWIFQFRFDFVFNLKYSVSFFSVFGIRTPPQYKSILVCDNTKMEFINFHKVSFKVYWPTMPTVKELFFTLGCGQLLHTQRDGFLCRSVTIRKNLKPASFTLSRIFCKPSAA